MHDQQTNQSASPATRDIKILALILGRISDETGGELSEWSSREAGRDYNFAIIDGRERAERRGRLPLGSAVPITNSPVELAAAQSVFESEKL